VKEESGYRFYKSIEAQTLVEEAQQYPEPHIYTKAVLD
jgi:hypothetical protein